MLPTVITETDRKKIQEALKEMSNSMLRIQAEKDLQKDIAERVKNDCNVPKKEFTRLARIYHASNLIEEAAREEEFMEFAQAVMEPLNAIPENI